MLYRANRLGATCQITTAPERRTAPTQPIAGVTGPKGTRTGPAAVSLDFEECGIPGATAKYGVLVGVDGWTDEIGKARPRKCSLNVWQGGKNGILMCA